MYAIVISDLPQHTQKKPAGISGGRWFMRTCCDSLCLPALQEHSDAEQRQRSGAGFRDGKIETTVGMICAAVGGALL